MLRYSPSWHRAQAKNAANAKAEMTGIFAIISLPQCWKFMEVQSDGYLCQLCVSLRCRLGDFSCDHVRQHGAPQGRSTACGTYLGRWARYDPRRTTFWKFRDVSGCLKYTLHMVSFHFFVLKATLRFGWHSCCLNTCIWTSKASIFVVTSCCIFLHTQSISIRYNFPTNIYPVCLLCSPPPPQSEDTVRIDMAGICRNSMNNRNT